MKQEDVIEKLRVLKATYNRERIGENPAAMSNHLGEFLGYATYLYDFYADALRNYEVLEARVTKEELKRMLETNSLVSSRDERVTVAEMEKAIDIRLSTEKGNRKRLEQLVKGATLHINGCQSLMRTWGDEAKGVR